MRSKPDGRDRRARWRSHESAATPQAAGAKTAVGSKLEYAKDANRIPKPDHNLDRQIYKLNQVVAMAREAQVYREIRAMDRGKT